MDPTAAGAKAVVDERNAGLLRLHGAHLRPVGSVRQAGLASRFLFALLGGVVFGWISWVLWRARDVFQPPA
jgi:hypothetical protein